MTLSANQNERIKKRATRLFEHFIEVDNKEYAMLYLVMLFQANPADALKKMESWITATKPETQAELANQIIGKVFNRNDYWLIENSFKNAPTKTVKDLVLLAYKFIRPDDDIRHAGVTGRDQARSGRSAIFSALHSSIGNDAYRAVIELSDTPEIGGFKHRFQQLAREMAERDGELLPWTENETLSFETKYIAPIKNGDTLYQCILNVLDDIRHGFKQNDASSKRLLYKLAEIKGENGKCKDDEKSVQNWLAEQLRLRANGRYHVNREPGVSDMNEPDIIISGTSGLFEIAIEVKQADLWSPNELKTALVRQLAEDYLKPQSRRHGILFLTDHGRRDWHHPVSKEKGFTFIQLQDFLSSIATATKTNATGNIKVSVFGIDGIIGLD